MIAPANFPSTSARPPSSSSCSSSHLTLPHLKSNSLNGSAEPFFSFDRRTDHLSQSSSPLRVWQLESVEHPLDVGGRISAGRTLERDERTWLQGLVDEGVMEQGRRVCGLNDGAVSKKLPLSPSGQVRKRMRGVDRKAKPSLNILPPNLSSAEACVSLTPLPPSPVTPTTHW